MPQATAKDGVKLYYEDTGEGTPILFIHEFAGDVRSWEPQVRYFSRRHRCITYNARGYPPSDRPDDLAMYSQANSHSDAKAVLDHLGIAKAHVVGFSMGGFTTLHFGLNYPEAALSLVVAGCGYGAEVDKREQFKQEVEATARFLDTEGVEAFADSYSVGPARVQFEKKDPRGWRQFRDHLADHDGAGLAATLRGVQKERPSLWDLKDEMMKLEVPTLIVTGDEDEPCLLPGVFMKRTIPSSGLFVMPKTGHTINLEDPDIFNRALVDFYAQVDAGRWGLRDPRADSATIMGKRGKPARA